MSAELLAALKAALPGELEKAHRELKELADTPHIRDFVALVGREMRGKAI